MSDPKSQIPINEQECIHGLECKNTHCRRKHPAGWKKPTKCMFGIKCTHPRCQGSGGGAVAFNPRSHQRVQPAQPAPPPPPTVDQIVEKICKLNGIGEISIYMIDAVQDKFAIINVLMNIDLILQKIRSLFEKEVVEETVLSKTVEEMIECVQQCSNQFSELDRNLFTAFDNMSQALMNQSVSTDSRKLSLGEFMKLFSLPEGIEDILQAFESQKASYSHMVSMSPLEVARMNPEGKPEPKLIEFLQLNPHVSSDPMLNKIIALHTSVANGKSTLTNKVLVGLYDSIMAARELDGLIEEQLATEIAKQEHKRTVKQIVSDIHCLNASNLAVSFNIMRNCGVFRKFVNKLDSSNKTILVQNFSNFLSVYSAWMSMSVSKDGSISVESLNGAFRKFLDSFKLDKESRDMDDEFFKFYRTPEFDELFKLLNLSCPSPDVKSGDGKITSSDILKRFLKAINGIFGSSVDASEKSVFESELANRGLVLLCMVMMSPDKFSKLVSAPFSKTYKDMESSPFKSFLYWLTQTATEGSKFNPNSFEWSTLPTLFTTKNRVGEQEFSTAELFDAIDATLSGFMSATNTGLNRLHPSEFLQEQSLDWLFGVQENPCLMYVNDEKLPLAVKRVLLSCYMVDESSDGARQVSHLKSLLSLPKEQIRPLLKLLIEMPLSEKKEENFDSICDFLGLEMPPQTKEIAFSALNEFLVMLNSLSLDSDLYSQALSMMSVFSYMQKYGKQSRYFMSMPSSIIFVLMTKQFPTLTHSEIANMIYKERYGHDGGTFFVNQTLVDQMIAGLHDSSSMKGPLELFAIRSSTENTRKVAIRECEVLIRKFKMLFEEHCPLLHEFLKRALPYFMKPEYTAKLFQYCDEQLEVLTSSQTPEDALKDRLKTSFSRFLMQAISQKKRQIFFDLSKMFQEIEKTCSVPRNLAFYKFARHVSAWINLVNSLFENIGIQHRISFDQIMKDFPDTKSKTLTPLEKAKLMTSHVCRVLRIPVPENTDDFVQNDENSVLFWVVYQALLATYNMVLPEKETELPKEVIVRRISIQDLKTLIEGSKTLDDVFSMSLPYMNSELIRAFLIQILMHHFMSGNKVKLDTLLRLLGRFELKFTPEEKSYCKGLFAYIEAPLPDIANLTSSVVSEKEFLRYSVVSEKELLSQIMDSLRDDGDWTDANVSVVISEEIVKRETPRFKFVKAPVKAPIDSGISFGGGCAAVDVEPEEEEHVEVSIEQEPVEASVKPPFDATQLREFLNAKNRSSAIAYLVSVELDDTLVATIDMLKDDANTCGDVIKALLQYGVFEED